VEQLLNLNYVAKLEGSQYCLKVNAMELTVGRVYREGPWRLPNNNQALEVDKTNYFAESVESANASIDEILDVSIVNDSRNLKDSD